MTVRELYEGVLIEVRKENFPHIHLRGFNHYLNEAVSEIVDDVYIAFETSQKSLDYLKALKKTVTITANGVTDPGDTSKTITLAQGTDFPSSVKFALPSNYRHLTGVVVKYKVNSAIPDECYEAGNVFQYGTKRLDDDTYSSIVPDPFQRPRYFEPKHAVRGKECHVIVGIKDGTNPLDPQLPLQVIEVQFNYLKKPVKYILTVSQANQDIEDTSQELEFDEITNRLIMDRVIQKILERNMDQRTASHTQVNQIQTKPDMTTGMGGQAPQQ